MERLTESGERFPASVSVSLLLTHGRSDRLLMTRHGVKKGQGETWGLIAGGVEKGETVWDAAVREAREEAQLNQENIIFVRGRNDFEPHVALIKGENKISLGLVLDVTYSGPKVPLGGWDVVGDRSVDRVEFFSWQKVLSLLDDKSRIYRPEFNYPQLLRWILKSCWTDSRRIEATNKWLLERAQDIEGLYRRTDKQGSILNIWSYVPPYNHWMTKPGIHGLPSKTNFARRRFKQFP